MKIYYAFCAAACLPVTVVMAGGYARQITDTVDIRYQTVALAAAYAAGAADRPAANG